MLNLNNETKNNHVLNSDLLGAHDEAELVELCENDANGGTAWACVAVGLVSAALCPTTKCTSRCR